MSETDVNTDFLSHWSFSRIAGSEMPFVISSECVRDASFLVIREARYISDHELKSDYHKTGNTWKQTLDISRFPQLKADNHKLLVALYNMALEEMQLNIRAQDTTFQAGAQWPDTWTRDAVYSIHLAFNYLLPDVSKRTLDKQTLKNPRESLQDTGSGGSWPISTDRVSWAIAAYEYYLATGDKEWLERCYETLRYTAQKDIHVAFDNKVNLFKGETASMDWRTHTYPNWFTNVNIGESYSSATNALHCFLYQFLATAGKILEKPEAEISIWNDYSTKIKVAINKHFWMEDKGYYSEYMLPRLNGYYVSPRGGCMSSGLCMTFGIADKARAAIIASKFPLVAYGALTLYPVIPDDFAYHNKGIWPVFESYLMLGAHKAGNEKATEHIMKSIVRLSALFLTNKENMTYETGYDRNTAINSDRQLWSVAAYLGLFYRIIFGMEFTAEGLYFQPSVPEQFYGPFELSNFKVRHAELDITVSGQGNVVKKVVLDGAEQSLPFVLPYSTSGKHKIEITVERGQKKSFNLVETAPDKSYTPQEPVLSRNGDKLMWKQQAGLKYMLWDGKERKEVTSPHTVDLSVFGIYSIYSVDSKGFQSDLSNPQLISPVTYRYEAEEAKHTGTFSNKHSSYSGRGFVVDLASKPANICFAVTISAEQAGQYMMRLVGSNGHGPDGTYCALRSVFVDGTDAGTFIMEGTGNWGQWENSNSVFISNLSAGKHLIEVKFNPENKGFDNNMSRNKENANDINVDYLELLRMSSGN
jgi:glycogen debranching enzyme